MKYLKQLTSTVALGLILSVLAGCGGVKGGGGGKSSEPSVPPFNINAPYNTYSLSDFTHWLIFGNSKGISDQPGLSLKYAGDDPSTLWASTSLDLKTPIDCSGGCLLQITVQGLNGAKTIGVTSDAPGATSEHVFNVSDGSVHTFSIDLPRGPFTGLGLHYGKQGIDIQFDFGNPAGSGISVTAVNLLQQTTGVGTTIPAPYFGTQAAALPKTAVIVSPAAAIDPVSPLADTVGEQAPGSYESVESTILRRQLNVNQLGVPNRDIHDVERVPIKK